MFNYDNERIFSARPADVPEHSFFEGVAGCSKAHTMPERVEHLARMLRDTLDRLKMFEESLIEKYDGLMANMTQDNVTFKQLMQDGWKEFTSAVRSEINLFESNIEAALKLFESATNEQLDNHLARIQSAELYMRENINASVENLLHEMESAGTLVGVIDSDVMTTVKRFGAVGDGATDDTAAFRSAFAALPSGGTVYVPNGVYLVTSDINVPSNITIKGDTLSVIMRAPTNVTEYAIFNVENAENVHFVNLRIIGERDNHTGTSGEWGMGISFTGAKNCTVEKCEITDCWGDGIYIGSHGTAGCENIRVDDATINGNRRNGISVINVDGLTVCNSSILNNGGTAPEYGVCFECNNDTERVKNTRISNCGFIGNKYGVGFSGSANLYEVTVDNCTFGHNNGVYVCRTTLDNVGGFINVQGCTFTGKNGVVFDAKTPEGIPVTLDGCKFFCDAIPVRIGYAELNADAVLGGIAVKNCQFERWGADYYPVMIRSGVHANSSYSDIYIDGMIQPRAHSFIFASSANAGSLKITDGTVPEKNLVSDIVLSAAGSIFTHANVNVSGGNRTIVLNESFPFGVDVHFRVTGSNVNSVTFACDDGIFAQVDSNTDSITVNGIYTVVTIRHEAANRWSFRKHTNN